jgi:GAF domain-containing protein
VSDADSTPIDGLGALVASARAAADDTGTALVPPLTDRVLASIPRACRATFAAAACSIAVVVVDELHYVAADGEGAEKVVGLRLPLGRGIAGWVAASGQALGLTDVQTDPRFDRERAAATGYVPNSMVVVPIADGDNPIGVLTILDPGAVDAERMGLAGTFADHAAVTILQSRTAQDVGRTVLRALADAAEARDDLVDALGRLIELPGARADRERAAVAELFQRLAALGDAERTLALDVLHDALTYAEHVHARR